MTIAMQYADTKPFRVGMSSDMILVTEIITVITNKRVGTLSWLSLSLPFGVVTLSLSLASALLCIALALTFQ